MVYLSTSEEWQRQSSMLLQARPTTTRITTKYKIPNLDSPKYQNSKKRKRTTEGEEKEDVPRAVLVLKAYDPASGVCLKLKTDRQADVGRLITGLGRLGRYMAALPEKSEDAVMEEPSGGLALNPSDNTSSTPAAADAKTQQAPTESAGGNKKKKKGKK
ncbi:Hypothetical protein R9X50_00483400 [Acrodontium crateriforme]|uniref:SRP9 domain-containing protein n=1 Tax=Acrodontium crateriforme TaxID=150365 RepID=A0AAQ3RB35_9PEZI|nr:Hypothetical protein R9X50_00483400 [Acrodontium crateriforme]